MKSHIERVPIADLKMNLFVRSRLDHDHVLMLASLVAESVDLGPILINEAWVVIDGRHRIEAHQLHDRVEIEAKVVDITDEAELIAEAFKANAGGSLPPTASDTEQTVMLLLDRGVNKKRIGEMLGLPKGLARTYVDNVQAKLARGKMHRAVAAVADDGLTVAQAVTTHGVNEAQLKAALSGRQQKVDGKEAIRAKLTRAHRSMAQTVTVTLRKVDRMLEDGEMTERQALATFKMLKKFQQKTERALADWQKRFTAKKTMNQP